MLQRVVINTHLNPDMDREPTAGSACNLHIRARDVCARPTRLLDRHASTLTWTELPCAIRAACVQRSRRLHTTKVVWVLPQAHWLGHPASYKPSLHAQQKGLIVRLQYVLKRLCTTVTTQPTPHLGHCMVHTPNRRWPVPYASPTPSRRHQHRPSCPMGHWLRTG